MVVLIVIESITQDELKMMRMRQRHEAVDLGGGIGEYHPIEFGFKNPSHPSTRCFRFEKAA